MLPYNCDNAILQRGGFAAPKARISRREKAEQLWYYLDSNREIQGPLELAALIEALRSSDSGGKTLVWTEGMQGWVAANACEELLNQVRDLQRARPSPTPRSQPSATAEIADHGAIADDTSVHPWRRFFARYLDLMLVALLLGAIISVLVEPHSEVDRLLNNNALFGILTVLILVPVEAIMFAAFGSTFGKVLYAINVGRNDGKPLHFGQAISRSFSVYLQGMGLGIPLVSLITNYLGYRTLRNTGAASWDKDRGLSVLHGRLGSLRITLIALVWLIILAVVALGIYAKVEGL